MFRCDKCRTVTGPYIPPAIVPIGFRKGPGIPPQGQRLGEAKLCPKCAKEYELEAGSGTAIAQALGAYYYRFLNQTSEPVTPEL